MDDTSLPMDIDFEDDNITECTQQLMDVDHVNNSCDDCDNLLNIKRIRQGKTGICWFASLLHIFNWSDAFRNRIYNKTTTLENALDLLNRLSSNPCTNDPHEAQVIAQHKPLTFLEDLVTEFISCTGEFFCAATSTSGGNSINYIIHFLVAMGYSVRAVKHLLVGFKNVEALNPTVDLRSVKYMRLASDYIKGMMQSSSNPRHQVEETEVFVLSFAQSSMDGRMKVLPGASRQLYLGKRIIFIVNGTVYVYLLDSMIMNAFNAIHPQDVQNPEDSTYRYYSHAICAITCNGNGYIVNTYNDDNETNRTQNCGLYKYDWRKWNDKKMFVHGFSHKINNVVCNAMLPNEEYMEQYEFDNNNLNLEKYYGKKEHFYYHRDIGNNSYIYVFENRYTPCSNVMEYYNVLFTEDVMKNYYLEYVMPYFVHFTTWTGIYVIEIVPPLPLLSNITEIQKGSGTLDAQFGAFTFTTNEDGKEVFMDIIPEYFHVYKHKKNDDFYVFVELKRGETGYNEYAGGKCSASKARKAKR